MDFGDDVTTYFQRSRDPRLIDDGRNKTERLSCACSSELKEFLNDLSRYLGVGASELVHRYVIEGIRADVMLHYCPRPYFEQGIRDSLKKAIKRG